MYTKEERVLLVQELREGLKYEGWLPPHSFKLRNPDKDRYEQVMSFHFRVGTPGIPWQQEQKLPRLERLRFYRECGYQMGFDNPVPDDDTIPPWNNLQNQLMTAVTHGYTTIEEVGKTFFELDFLLGRAIRSFDLPSNEVTREVMNLRYTILSPYKGGPAPLLPIPLVELPQKGWVMECQEFFQHLKLTHYDDGKSTDLQYEDDPYLVNIAEEYLLLLLFRANLPPEQQLQFSRYSTLYDEFLTWGPAQLSPKGTQYGCPSWMEHILNQGYY